MPNNTNITPPRVPIIDLETGYVTREWYRFFYNLFYLTGSGQNDWSIEDIRKTPQEMSAEAFAKINTLYNAALSMPSSESGELTARLNNLAQRLQTQPRDELGTMAAVQQDNVRYLRFSNSPSPAPSTTETGTVYWDGGTTMNVVMTPHVVQAVGESQYYYIKCSEALGVKRGQLIMFDGAVGASNQLKGKLATGLTSGDYLMGVAAEDIAHNGFGLVTSFGTVASLGNQKVDTSVWPLGTILYYDPATPGGLTSTLPSAPNVKATIAAVTESSNSGAIFVRVSFGSKLGETDSNVQFSSLVDKDIIQYDSALGYWKNVAPSTVVIGTATNLAGGAAGSVPYQSAAATTTFLSIGTSMSMLYSTGSAPAWSAVLNWDEANKRLGIGTSGSPAYAFDVRPQASNSVFVGSNSNVFGVETKWNNSLGLGSIWTVGAYDLVIGRNSTETARINSTGFSLTSGSTYQINGSLVLSATGLGSTVISSSLTSVGTISTGVWNGTAITVSYGGTGLTSGTSGGVPYFNATSTMASSAALAANALVIGGGAGAAPSTITTGTGVVTALGVNTGTAGSFVVNGGALGTPASGNFSTGTFTWPIFNQNTTGSAGSVANSVTFTNTGGAAAGTTFNGSAARTIDYSTIGASPVAGSSSIVTVGTITSGTWNGTAVAVAYGGTGATTAGITSFNNITGYTATGATGTTSTNLVFSTSPTLTTPKATTTIGVGNATAAASGAGISFPATASGSSDANTLDDYEEGSFTPTYQAGTTDFTSITYDIQTGRYTKIGNMVQVTIQLRTTNVNNTGAAGVLKIAGLPFTSTSGAGSVGSGVGYATNFNSNYPLSINYTANSTALDLYYRAAVTGATVVNTYVDLLNGAAAAGNYLAVTFTYRTAA